MWFVRKIKDIVESPFPKVPINQKRRGKILQKAPADTRLIMMFTPRSGSSRITDLARQSGRLSHMDEAFNPALMRGIVKSYGAHDMADYLDLLVRERNCHGVYSAQLTYAHVVSNFVTGSRFSARVAPTAFCWLIREDIVAQAVSAVRVAQTQVAHAAYTTPEDLRASEGAFTYDPDRIRRTLRYLRWMETRTEALFARLNVSPLRLSYEQSVGCAPQDLVRAIADKAGVEMPADLGDLVSEHQKLPKAKGTAFADRFRSENPNLLRKVDAQRAPMLDQLRLERRVWVRGAGD